MDVGSRAPLEADACGRRSAAAALACASMQQSVMDDLAMGVVAVSDEVTWVVSRAAFRALLRRSAELVRDDADVYALEQAEALDGLHLDLMQADQALRLAVAVRDAAGELAKDAEASKDDWDRSFARSLRELVTMLAPRTE
jgi:hypothetical protein